MTTEEEITHNAAIMFADLGFHGTSMGNIAKACEKNKATLYHYYKSKELLYEKILEDYFGVFNEALERNISLKGTFADKLRQFTQTILDLDILSARIIFRLSMDDKSALPSSILTLLHRRKKIFETLFKEGISKGEFKMMDPKNIYLFLIGSSFMFIFENSSKPSDSKEKSYLVKKEAFLSELMTSVLDTIILDEDIVL